MAEPSQTSTIVSESSRQWIPGEKSQETHRSTPHHVQLTHFPSQRISVRNKWFFHHEFALPPPNSQHEFSRLNWTQRTSSLLVPSPHGPAPATTSWSLGRGE